MFYPRGLVVVEVGCSLFLVEGVLSVLQYKEQLHYGLGSNLTDLESPLRHVHIWVYTSGVHVWDM